MREMFTKILVMAAALATLSFCGAQDNNRPVDPPKVDLHLAALTGNLRAVEQHIAADSDIDEKDSYGSTPLIVAITFNKTEVAKALIDAGADLTIANNDDASPASYRGLSLPHRNRRDAARKGCRYQIGKSGRVR